MYKIVTTTDGSSTLIREDLDEHYHSVHGAYNEAMHVFITSGLANFKNHDDPINILEIGLGTGLNAILSLVWAEKHGKKINYVGVDNFPLDIDTITKLNYPDLETLRNCKNTLETMHNSSWEMKHNISSRFVLTKINADFNDFTIEESIDLVYFDAFSPRTQPELWTKDLFQKLYNLMSTSGVFVTYSAKGSVRRDLISVGFEVEKIPGPPGKREMLRCYKRQN